MDYEQRDQEIKRRLDEADRLVAAEATKEHLQRGEARPCLQRG